MEYCPICKQHTLQPTDFNVSVLSVLRRWEEAIQRPFPQKVWEQYERLGNQTLTYFECSACGFGCFDPVVGGTAEFYEAISAVDYYNADKWEFACAASEMLAFGAKRILDVGCGTGIFLDYLKERIPDGDFFGFDLNSEILDRLAARGYGALPHNTSEFREAIEGKPLFDAISMLQVLEHAGDPEAFLNQFLPMLKPGGLLIVTTPNSAGPIKNFPDALTEIPPHHLTRWTENTFRCFLPRHGMKVCSVKFEPLPDYLWDSYLPLVWDIPIWPARIFDPIARQRGLVSVGERSGMAAEAMRQAGIRWLEGIPGHTIYVAACRVELE